MSYLEEEKVNFSKYLINKKKIDDLFSNDWISFKKLLVNQFLKDEDKAFDIIEKLSWSINYNLSISGGAGTLATKLKKELDNDMPYEELNDEYKRLINDDLYSQFKKLYKNIPKGNLSMGDLVYKDDLNSINVEKYFGENQAWGLIKSKNSINALKFNKLIDSLKPLYEFVNNLKTTYEVREEDEWVIEKNEEEENFFKFISELVKDNKITINAFRTINESVIQQACMTYSKEKNLKEYTKLLENRPEEKLENMIGEFKEKLESDIGAEYQDFFNSVKELLNKGELTKDYLTKHSCKDKELLLKAVNHDFTNPFEFETGTRRKRKKSFETLEEFIDQYLNNEFLKQLVNHDFANELEGCSSIEEFINKRLINENSKIFLSNNLDNTIKYNEQTDRLNKILEGEFGLNSPLFAQIAFYEELASALSFNEDLSDKLTSDWIKIHGLFDSIRDETELKKSLVSEKDNYLIENVEEQLINLKNVHKYFSLKQLIKEENKELLIDWPEETSNPVSIKEKIRSNEEISAEEVYSLIKRELIDDLVKSDDSVIDGLSVLYQNKKPNLKDFLTQNMDFETITNFVKKDLNSSEEEILYVDYLSNIKDDDWLNPLKNYLVKIKEFTEEEVNSLSEEELGELYWKKADEFKLKIENENGWEINALKLANKIAFNEKIKPLINRIKSLRINEYQINNRLFNEIKGFVIKEKLSELLPQDKLNNPIPYKTISEVEENTKLTVKKTSSKQSISIVKKSKLIGLDFFESEEGQKIRKVLDDYLTNNSYNPIKINEELNKQGYNFKLENKLHSFIISKTPGTLSEEERACLLDKIIEQTEPTISEELSSILNVYNYHRMEDYLESKKKKQKTKTKTKNEIEKYLNSEDEFVKNLVKASKKTEEIINKPKDNLKDLIKPEAEIASDIMNGKTISFEKKMKSLYFSTLNIPNLETKSLAEELNTKLLSLEELWNIIGKYKLKEALHKKDPIIESLGKEGYRYNWTTLKQNFIYTLLETTTEEKTVGINDSITEDNSKIVKDIELLKTKSKELSNKIGINNKEFINRVINDYYLEKTKEIITLPDEEPTSEEEEAAFLLQALDNYDEDFNKPQKERIRSLAKKFLTSDDSFVDSIEEKIIQGEGLKEEEIVYYITRKHKDEISLESIGLDTKIEENTLEPEISGTKTISQSPKSLTEEDPGLSEEEFTSNQQKILEAFDEELKDDSAETTLPQSIQTTEPVIQQPQINNQKPIINSNELPENTKLYLQQLKNKAKIIKGGF